MAVTAGVLINPRFKATDKYGKPLVGGKVYAYQAGSTTEQKDTYADPNLNAMNTWPVVLDDAGSASIYISGDYYIRIDDANDVFVMEGDGVADAYSVAVAVVADAGGGSGTLESRVADLESEVDDLQDQTNTISDTLNDYIISNNAALAAQNVALTAAIAAAVAAQNTAMLAAVAAEATARNTQIVAQQIKPGGLYVTQSSENPSVELGYGTWARAAEGAAIVGLSTNVSHPAWTKTVGTVYGEYEHTMTLLELVGHGHGMPQGAVASTPGAYTSGDDTAASTIGGTPPNTTSTGSGTPFNVVQFSEVWNVWRRTA